MAPTIPTIWPLCGKEPKTGQEARVPWALQNQKKYSSTNMAMASLTIWDTYYIVSTSPWGTQFTKIENVKLSRDNTGFIYNLRPI